ncbi:MAG: hypothetical protein V8T87_03510 [Victivallales bacterium]
MAVTSRKPSVSPASVTVSASSFGVFWRTAPFDQCDHPVEERLAGSGGDLHLDPVGEHAGAAGHAGAVAAGLAHHRRGFAGDRGFVDAGDAFDHFAVARDGFPCADYNDVAGLK